MKKLFILLSLIVMSQAQAAKPSATHVVEYDHHALDLLDTLTQYCGAELAKAIKAWHRPGSGNYVYSEKSGRRVYTIKFVQGGGMMPMFNTGKLVLKLTPKPMDPLIADAPTEYRADCDLKLK